MRKGAMQANFTFSYISVREGETMDLMNFDNFSWGSPGVCLSLTLTCCLVRQKALITGLQMWVKYRHIRCVFGTLCARGVAQVCVSPSQNPTAQSLNRHWAHLRECGWFAWMLDAYWYVSMSNGKTVANTLWRPTVNFLHVQVKQYTKAKAIFWNALHTKVSKCHGSTSIYYIWCISELYTKNSNKPQRIVVDLLCKLRLSYDPFDYSQNEVAILFLHSSWCRHVISWMFKASHTTSCKEYRR